MSGVWHIGYMEIALRLLLAAALGGAVGFERGWKQRSAGFRTHILVSIGAALLMILSIYGFGGLHADPINHPGDPSVEPNLLADPSRLAAQVISGMGFLGAGVIFTKGKAVFGLTTAASVWVVAATGLCVGAGFFFCAVVLAAMVLLVQLVLKRFERPDR
ncbi:MgtC/SapB family protein [Paenibacillus hamazuiensis]|uniref:MgtC/SapB family protein n=1 Tax=Paenibacillus hamazuiensis TaxID=2936508 RepID=UPI00200FCA41|nr:MgtC/SapB family protein [Paenibacillus hamazuiensis]